MKSFRLTKGAQRTRKATTQRPPPPPGARSARQRPHPCRGRARRGGARGAGRPRADSEHDAGPAEGRPGASRLGVTRSDARPLKRPEGPGARSSHGAEQRAPPGASGPVRHVPRRACAVWACPGRRVPSAASWEGVTADTCRAGQASQDARRDPCGQPRHVKPSLEGGYRRAEVSRCVTVVPCAYSGGRANHGTGPGGGPGWGLWGPGDPGAHPWGQG